MKYIRVDIDGKDWCSPEYMAKKIGLSRYDCAKFLSGPVRSMGHALEMTHEQAAVFSTTELTAEAEAVDNE